MKFMEGTVIVGFCLLGVILPATAQVQTHIESSGTVSTSRGGTIIPINPGNFYVDGPIGNDRYNCLAASIADGKGPCLTIRHAAEAALSYDAHGKNYDVHISPGKYQGLSIPGNIWGGTRIGSNGGSWELDGAGSSYVTVDDTGRYCGAIYVGTGMEVQIKGLTITKTGGCNGGGSDLFVQNHGRIWLGPDVSFGSAGSSLLHIEAFGQVETNVGFTVSGSARVVFSLSNNAYMEFDPGGHVTITCVGSPAFRDFIYASANSTLYFPGDGEFSGCSAVTGNQFEITTNSVIYTNGGRRVVFLGNGLRLTRTGATLSVLPKPYIATASQCPHGSIGAGSSDFNFSVLFSAPGSSSCAVTFQDRKQRPPNCEQSTNYGASAISIRTGTNGVLLQQKDFQKDQIVYVGCHGMPD